jgi:hypothetical protein
MSENKPGFLDSWKNSKNALNFFKMADDLFRRSRAESDLRERVRLQMQAVYLERKALQCLAESNRFQLRPLDKQKADNETQNADQKNRKKPATEV